MLADFVEKTEWSSLPEDVTNRAKMLILDFLGVALVGSTKKQSRMLAELLFQLGGKEESIVIGHPQRTSCINASLADGFAGDACDFGDDYRHLIHPGPGVIAAALAIAERESADGKSFLASVVAGYDVSCRLAETFLGFQFDRGFISTGTCNVFGAAAAASKILRLDRNLTTNALGIAGMQASGLGEFKTGGSWTKPLNPGRAAQYGVFASLLAQRGLTGPASIIEGKRGFLRAFSYKGRWDTTRIRDKLGKEYKVMLTGVKRFPCSYPNNAIAQATMEVVKKYNIKPEQVKKVMVRCSSKPASDRFARRRYTPETAVDAQFSAPYVVALAISRGRISLRDFTDEGIRDNQVLDVASKVKGIEDDAYTKEYLKFHSFPASVRIVTKEGKAYECRVDKLRGQPDNPIYKKTPELFHREIEEKFRTIMSAVPEYNESADAIVDLVKNLDKVEHVQQLTELFQVLPSPIE